jgi:hypothetical protein
MKTNKKSFIFALLFGVLIISLPEIVNASVNGKEERPQGTIIASGSEVKFASYIESILPQYTKQGNWSIIEEVVTLYIQQPSKIRTISAETQQSFENAVSELGKKLETVNSIEALQWKGDLEKTVGAVRFVRNFDINSIAGDKIEMPVVKAPISVVSL